MFKRLIASCLLILLALTAPSATAQFAIFQVSATATSGGGGNGGGANLRIANIYGVPNTVSPSSYYTPGIASQAVSTADFFNEDGFFWPRPYDLNAMGTQGQAAAALYGRYYWPMTPDHPTGVAGNWTDGQDFKGGFSDDPGVMPTAINRQVMPTCLNLVAWGGSATNPRTSNSMCGYHLAFISYAPEDTGNVFHWYNESQDQAAAPGPGLSKTGTTVNGSPIVTGISGGTALLAGGVDNPVTGTGIPANSTILLVGRQLTGTITNGSAIVTGISSTTGINGGGCGGGGDTIYGVTQAPLPGTQVCVSTVDGQSQVTMTTNALSTSASGIIIDNGSTVTLNNNATASGSPTLTFKSKDAMQHYAGAFRSNDLISWTNYGPVTDNWNFNSFTSYIRPTRVSAGVWTEYTANNYEASRRIDGPPGDAGIDPNGYRSLAGVSTGTNGLDFARPGPRPVPAAIPTAVKIGTRSFQTMAYDPVTISSQVWIPVVEDARNVIISNANPAVVTKNAHGLIANATITFATTGTNVSVHGDTVNGSAVVTNMTNPVAGTGTAGLQAGMAVNPAGRGLAIGDPGSLPIAGVPAGALILTVDGPSQITLTTPATATLTQALIYVATMPPPIVPNTTYYVKTVLSADTFTISATPGGAAISTAGASQCFVSVAAGTCIYVPDGGMYVARVAVDSNMNVLPSPAPVRISSVYSGVFPGPTYLQTVNSYLEDGIMHYYALRGFFVSAPNFWLNNGGTYNSGYGALQQQLVDYYTEITDATAAAQAAPVGITISAASGIVTLNWLDALPNQTYRLYRGNAAAQTTQIGSDITGLTATDSTPPLNQVVTYKLVTLQSGTERQSRKISTFVSSSTAFTNKHVTRALADGADYGTCDLGKIDAAYNFMVAQVLFNSVINWVNPAFCVAKNASGVISKMYDLGTTRLPKYNDLWFCSGNPCTGASLTTYDPLGLNGTTAAWVNGASNAFGIFGGLLDSNRNGRLNHIRRLYEFTVYGSYAKAASGTNISLFGLGETNTLSLRHLAGTPGSASFILADDVTFRTATAPFTGTATAPHTIGGTFGATGNLIAYADGVGGTPATGLHVNSDLALATTLKGQLGDLTTAVVGVVGSPTSRFTYGSPSTYGQLTSEASSTNSDLVLFGKELTPTQMAALHTLTSQQVTPVVAQSYNITSAPYSATCNGVANDSASFSTWITAAAAWDAANPSVPGDIVLNIPNSTCMFLQGGSGISIVKGIVNHRVRVVGAGTSAKLSDGGTGGGFFPGVNGQFNDNVHQARISTVSKGATSVTPTACPGAGCAAALALYTVGQWALVTGVDYQGEGFPTNPAFWDYVLVSGKTATDVQFTTTPLTNNYKSTWPSYSTGGAFAIDQGGPATLYALDPSWGITVVYDTLIFDQTNPGASGYSIPGKSVTLQNMTINGTTSCGVPSQNKLFQVIKVAMTSCTYEVDKLIDELRMEKVSAIPLVDFQTASVKIFSVDGSTITTLNGNGITNYITGSTITNLLAGAHSFGASTGSLNIGTTAFTALTNGGASQNNINLRMSSWTGGTLTIPPNRTVSGAISGTAGVIRLTVDSSAGYTAGMVTSVNASPCTSGQQDFTISAVPTGTTIELAGTTFTATCTGSLGSLPLTWDTPGANVYFASAGTTMGPVLQVNDLTQDSSGTHITFNQNGSAYAGGFPTMALSGSPNTASIKVHPAPQFTCVSCTGSAAALALSRAPAGLPLWSYFDQTYVSATTPFVAPIWGSLVNLSIAVNVAGNSGSGFNLDGPFVDILNTTTRTAWTNELINGAVTGTRNTTPTTATGNQSGDTWVAPGAGAWWENNQMTPKWTGTVGSGSVRVLMQTNQGVVNQFVPDENEWRHLVGANDNAAWRQAI